jgi:hypothetical protein
MKPSSELYELIHSLSPAEKRYFKLFASLHNKKGSNSYLKVFDAIEKQAEYDEAEVIQEAGGKKMASQFPVVKNYLYKLILKSLRNFHSGQSVDFRLKEWLMNVEILLRKELIEQCIKILEKARRTAIEYEKYEYFLEILSYDMSLAMKVSEADLDKVWNQVEAFFAEADTYYEKFKNILTHRKLSMQLLILNRKEQHLRSDYSLKAYSDLMQHPITQGIGETRSVKARMFYLQSSYIFHFARSDYDRAYEAGSAMVMLMEEHPFLVEERPGNYLSALQNQVTMGVATLPFDRALGLVEKLKSFSAQFPRVKFEKGLEQKATLFAYLQQTSLYDHYENHAQGMEKVPEITAWLDGQDLKFNLNEGFVVLAIYLSMAKLAIFSGHNSDGLRLVNRILNHPGIGSGYWMHLTARLMQILFYLELGEFSLVESASTSLYRFLEKRKQLHRFERILMRFMRKTGNSLGNGGDISPLYRDLREELRKISDDPFEKNAFQQFDLPKWLDRRIDGVAGANTSGKP